MNIERALTPFAKPPKTNLRTDISPNPAAVYITFCNYNNDIKRVVEIEGEDQAYRKLIFLNVRSDYEEEKQLNSILKLITPSAYEWFQCKMIATKAPIYAVERITALETQGYKKSNEKLVGHDGTIYGDYWERAL